MDWTLIYLVATLLILPTLIYGVIAQSKTHHVFHKYSNYFSSKGVTASQLAQALLNQAGITNVRIKEIEGDLTDCYDPHEKIVNLSSSTYNSTSLSALGVCAHEVGHAIQDAKGSFLFKLRSTLVPVVNFISGAFLPLIIIGSLINYAFYIPMVGYYICLASVISYGASLVFQLVTLPLERDASRKALNLLKQTNAFSETEIKQSKQVLDAAIHTYIASMLTTLVYFLRFLSFIMMFTRDRD